MRKIVPVLFSLLLLPVIFMSGCSGSGSSATVGSAVSDSSPEAAATEIFRNLLSSSYFRVGNDGRILAQETSSGSTGYITFKDMSGETWQFLVEKVEYLSEVNAAIHTSYYYSGAPQYGGVKVIFNMVKDQNVWYLDTMSIVEVPVVVVAGTGIKGVITDKVTNQAVSAARVEAYNSSSLLAGYAVTDSGGYYEITGLTPGTYYLVISRDGYAPYTISGIQVN